MFSVVRRICGTGIPRLPGSNAQEECRHGRLSNDCLGVSAHQGASEAVEPVGTKHDHARLGLLNMGSAANDESCVTTVLDDTLDIGALTRINEESAKDVLCAGAADEWADSWP